jgi:hypothetical protein
MKYTTPHHTTPHHIKIQYNTTHHNTAHDNRTIQDVWGVSIQYVQRDEREQVRYQYKYNVVYDMQCIIALLCPLREK